MHNNGFVPQMILSGSILSCFFLGCGSDRVNMEFKTPGDIYVDERTDPDKLNRQLEYDLREAEKKRRQKERETADAKARAEAEKKAKETKELPAEEATQPEQAGQSTPQQ
ncbi:MAG TPA: hypothetical protein ACFYDZ_02480 [Candidatus Brocadiaceae bacterium]